MMNRTCLIRRRRLVAWWLRVPVIAAVMLAALGRASAAGEAGALDDLRAWLSLPAGERPPIAEQAFARVALSSAEALEAGRMLWDDHAAEIRRTRVAELEAREMRSGNARMRFETVDFPPDGDQPAPSRRSVNDSQWRNQVKLAERYRPSNAVYVAPRAPADSAAMWSVPAVDACFDRLIETMIVLENVDPDQVYLMGYSAGGDGAYQLAPRFADRLAAAAAMAGHPNDSSPLGLRNLPFTIHVGQNDRAYGRNNVAVTWRDKLTALKSDDPAGYEHVVHVHEGKGHWMDMEDREAIPWMQAFRRQPLPQRVVWRQGHATHPRFYWLAAAADSVHVGDEVEASRDGSTIDVTIRQGKPRVIVRLNDAMLDLDSDVTIRLAGRPVFAGRPPRTVAVLQKTIRERGDPAGPSPAPWHGRETIAPPSSRSWPQRLIRGGAASSSCSPTCRTAICGRCPSTFWRRTSSPPTPPWTGRRGATKSTRPCFSTRFCPISP